MNEKRIAIGIVACFLGIIVPVHHHIALHAAIAHERTNNNITRMQSVWDFLPWTDWAYCALMWIVGIALLLSGFGLLPSRAAPRPVATPRGFEVVNVTDPNAKH